MSQIYEARRRAGTVPQARTLQTEVAGPSIKELAAGAQPTDAQMGHRVDLPDAIREKMESSFGADFSNVKLYESQTVADAGAEAMTQGSNIAFAPGQLDLTSTAGQALLGHELSHVVSQSRGESAGQGFLSDARLEAQADAQGMMAAQGESVYSGPVTPVGVSSAASAAGPMQAKKKKDIIKDTWRKDFDNGDKLRARRKKLERIPRIKGLMKDLEDKPWGPYAMEKIAQAENAEQRRNIVSSFSGSDESAKEFLRNDLIDLTGKLSARSSELVNEDFKTRHNAWAESTGLFFLLSSLNGNRDKSHNVNISEILNEDDAAAFNTAQSNFSWDYTRVREDMVDSERKPKGRYSQRFVKGYRKKRREGMTGREIIASTPLKDF